MSMIGKTVHSWTIKKHSEECDGMSVLEIRMTDGSLYEIEGGYGAYTGDSCDEYPETITTPKLVSEGAGVSEFQCLKCNNEPASFCLNCVRDEQQKCEREHVKLSDVEKVIDDLTYTDEYEDTGETYKAVEPENLKLTIRQLVENKGEKS